MAQRLVTAWSTRLALGVLLFVASAWLDHRTADAQGSPAGSPKRGGVLRVGMIGEPPTLDAHTTTAVITREITINIFEGLFALDARFQPVPLLAEGYEVLDGAKRYAIRLRKDVKFHNGKILTSADVVASLKRWGAMASPGKAVWKNVEAIEAKGPSAIEIRLKEPSGSLLTVLAQVDSAAVIYPKEVIDATGEGQLKEIIGTGPFKFVEHKPDRHIKLVRFDGYAPRAEPASGLAGQRVAYLDELDFLPVPDYATRQAGMVTGEYGYIQQVKPDQYERIKSAAGVEPVVRQALWLGHRGAEHQARADDGQAAAPGDTGGARRRPADARGPGPQGLLPDRSGPVLPGAGVALQGRRGASTTSATGTRRGGSQGGRLPGSTGALDRDHRVRASLQAGRSWPRASSRRSASRSTCRSRTGPRSSSGATSRSCGTPSARRSRSCGADHLVAGPLRVAGLVVQRGEGRGCCRRWAASSTQEALRHLGERPDDVLRGGRAHQDR